MEEWEKDLQKRAGIVKEQRVDPVSRLEQSLAGIQQALMQGDMNRARAVLRDAYQVVQELKGDQDAGLEQGGKISPYAKAGGHPLD